MIVLAGILLVLTVWLAVRRYKIEAAREYSERNGTQPRYRRRIPRWVVVCSSLALVASLAYWPLIAAANYSEASRVARQVTPIIGADLDASGFGVNSQGDEYRCDLVNYIEGWGPVTCTLRDEETLKAEQINISGSEKTVVVDLTAQTYEVF